MRLCAPNVDGCRVVAEGMPSVVMMCRGHDFGGDVGKVPAERVVGMQILHDGRHWYGTHWYGGH